MASAQYQDATESCRQGHKIAAPLDRVTQNWPAEEEDAPVTRIQTEHTRPTTRKTDRD